MTKIDEEALEKAFLAEPQSGEDWFDTVAGATGLTDEENRTLLRCAITAYLTALEAKGYAIVPSEPTEGMLVDGSASLRNFYSEEGPYPRTKAVYRAMLAARGE